jgi:hypothetical protein
MLTPIIAANTAVTPIILPPKIAKKALRVSFSLNLRSFFMGGR